MRPRSWLLWVVAFVVTAGAGAYQRISGPTYPVRGQAVIDSVKVAYRLPRSRSGAGDAVIELAVQDTAIQGTLEFRRFRSHDDWSRQPLERHGETLLMRIPHQPPAGKVMYWIHLQRGATRVALTPEPVIIRFTGAVPRVVLIPHIVAMVAAMLLSARAGLEALFRRPRTYQLTLGASACLLVGALILGPAVQKYAFDAFWTGWPFGHDLTDNKAAVAMLFWLVALWRVRKKRAARGWVIAASLVTLLVWFIPHSVLGSELDYTQMPE